MAHDKKLTVVAILLIAVLIGTSAMAKPYGKLQGCIGCHGTRANNDFVIVHDIE